MPGLIEEAIRLGVESPSLRKEFVSIYQQFKQQELPMDWNIQYNPRDIAAIVTLIRGCDVQSYLAFDSSQTGGHRFLEEKCNIPLVEKIDGGDDAKKEKLKLKQIKRAYDLISIDTREYKIPPEKLWQWIEGGMGEQEGFGTGAPTNFGIKKISPKGLVLINFTKEEDRKLFFKLRRRYNKVYQSQNCGMVKL